MILDPASVRRTDVVPRNRLLAPIRNFHGSLITLVLAGLIPVFLFAAVMFVLFVKQERAAVEAELIGITRAVSVAVDRELARQIEALERIAASEHLDANDLRAFYDFAQLMQRQEDWLAIVVNDPASGEQLLNTKRPFGSPLPHSLNLSGLHEVAATGRPFAGGVLLRGNVLPEPLILLRVPVIRAGAVTSTVSAGMKPTALNRILTEQKLPYPGWLIAVLDSNMTIAARSRAQEQFVGQRATPSLIEKIEAAEEGLFLSLNKEGDPVYTIFRKSMTTGWTVAIGIPAAVIDGPLQGTLITLGAIGLALVIVAVALAAFIGHNIARRQHAEEDLRAAQAELEAKQRVTLIAAKEQAELERNVKSQSLKMAEEQLHHAQKLEAVGRLTGGVAHDFNNLLMVILGNAELLATELPKDSGLRSQAELIQEAAERGAELIEQLLAFGRRQALQPAELDLNKLVSSTGELLRRTLGEDIAIQMNLGAGLWLALADPSQVESALLNLAINARDAMPSGGKLTIETANTDLDEDYAAMNSEVTPGQYVLLAVTDTGAGMPPEIVARVFEPFFTTKEVGKGSGLGLSMVYGFIKQSGGHVKIYSEVDEGTTVSLYLPRAEGQRPRESANPQAVEPHPTGNETILVVEDEAPVRNYVVQQLRSLGYNTIEATTGTMALSELEKADHVDLLFTDVIMPGGMNGRELADEALRRRPRLKVLFTSGYTETAIVHQGKLDPGVQLLNKPYRKHDLARKIRSVLDN